MLVKRIYSIADEMAARHPEIEFLKAPYLRTTIPLCSTPSPSAWRRSSPARPSMNCQLCKYREQVIGFEAEIGLPQAGHHHHVQGIGTNADSRP